MSAVMYQTMPPLSTEEYAQLEQSILAEGIQVPILVDDSGVVIDGHHRKAIADHHGLHCPREVRSMLTDAQKTALSISLNIARRQLNREQKRAIIEAAVKAEPELTDREHARRVGASPSTIGAVRAQLEDSGEVSKLDTRMDPRGYEQPAERPRPASVDADDFTFDQDGIVADARTGEVLDDEPAPVEVSHTETSKTTEKRAEPKAPREKKPVLTGDDAERANAIQTSKAVGQALASLERFQYENARTKFLHSTWPTGREEVQPIHRALVAPTELRNVAESLITLASEMESNYDYQ